jgi:hypothetical protein
VDVAVSVVAQDFERLAETLVGLHFVAFAILMLSRLVQLAGLSA